jgi:hypothetical protein
MVNKNAQNIFKIEKHLLPISLNITRHSTSSTSIAGGSQMKNKESEPNKTLLVTSVLQYH